MMTKCISLILLIAVMLSVMMAPAIVAKAERTSAGDVLSDLMESENFDQSLFPGISSDYTLELLTIAESVDDELLLYVYQPGAISNFYRATEVRIATAIAGDFVTADYRLALMDSDGVFFKYKVRDLEVDRSTEARSYEIIQLGRPFIVGVDQPADYDNTIGIVPFGVNRVFDISEGDEYSMIDTRLETVEITDKFVGTMRYATRSNQNGDPLQGIDRQFVAFSTDHRIDELIEIELIYSYQIVRSVLESVIPTSWYYVPDPVKTYQAHNTNQDYFDYDRQSFWNTRLINQVNYRWDVIQSTEEFFSTVDDTHRVYAGAFINIDLENQLSSVGIDAVSGKEWVISFRESPFLTEAGGEAYLGATFVSALSGTELAPFYTTIGDVSVLRLKFATDGYLYNLGVVDNKQSAAADPVSRLTVHISKTERLAALTSGLGSALKVLAAVVLGVVGIFFIFGVSKVAVSSLVRSSKHRRRK